MKTVLQRVKSASVTVDGNLISSIHKGILVFAAIAKDDTTKDVESMASKVLRTKLWEDENGFKWKRNVQDIDAEILCVSQFTLLASTKKGNKPDFHRSANGQKAQELYQLFFKEVQRLYAPERVKDGIFQAMMDVSLINDGPVTLQIDTEPAGLLDLDSESSSVLMTRFDDLPTTLQKLVKTYDIPVELLQ